MTVEQKQRIVVVSEQIRETYPTEIESLEHLLPEIPFVWAKEKQYDDGSPKLDINVLPHTEVVAIPGFYSGKTAEDCLHSLGKIGFNLGYVHPNDERSPRAKYIHYLLFDGEGRGNKPTRDVNGEYIPESEFHFAFYAARYLREMGYAKEITIIDPHDRVSTEAFGVLVNVLSALPEAWDYMREKKLITTDARLLIADNGAIGRTLYFSEISGIPIGGRIVKKRINGKPTIQAIYGMDNIKGKDMWMVDDILGTAGTLKTDSVAIMPFEPNSVNALVTHTKGVAAAKTKLAESPLKNIIVTNSTPYAEDLLGLPNPSVHIVKLDNLFSIALKAIVTPTLENIKKRDAYKYPMRSEIENLRLLHERYGSELAPDYGKVYEHP